LAKGPARLPQWQFRILSNARPTAGGPQFDCLVGERLQHRRDFETERLDKKDMLYVTDSQSSDNQSAANYRRCIPENPELRFEEDEWPDRISKDPLIPL
jgi:hypothetical protein